MLWELSFFSGPTWEVCKFFLVFNWSKYRFWGMALFAICDLGEESNRKRWAHRSLCKDRRADAGVFTLSTVIPWKNMVFHFKHIRSSMVIRTWGDEVPSYNVGCKATAWSSEHAVFRLAVRFAVKFSWPPTLHDGSKATSSRVWFSFLTFLQCIIWKIFYRQRQAHHFHPKREDINWFMTFPQ